MLTLFNITGPKAQAYTSTLNRYIRPTYQALLGRFVTSTNPDLSAYEIVLEWPAARGLDEENVKDVM